MTHFDGLDTLDGRHLAAIYAFVLMLQSSYALWIYRRWRKLGDHQNR